MSAIWNRAQLFGQPLTLIADRLVEVRQPPLQLGVEVLRVLLGLDDRELAELEAGAGHRAAAERARAHQQVVLGQRGDQVLDLLVRRRRG